MNDEHKCCRDEKRDTPQIEYDCVVKEVAGGVTPRKDQYFQLKGTLIDRESGETVANIDFRFIGATQQLIHNIIEEIALRGVIGATFKLSMTFPMEDYL